MKPPLLTRIRLFLVDLILGDISYVSGVEVRGADTFAGVFSGSNSNPLVIRLCKFTNETPGGVYALSKDDIKELRSMK